MNGRKFEQRIRQVLIGMLLGAGAACMTGRSLAESPAGTHAPPLPPPLAFHQAADLARLSTYHSSLTWAAPAGVRVAFEKTDWPSVSFKVGRAFESSNWSHVGGMGIEVRNPEDTPLELHVRIDDDAIADGSRHSSTCGATLGPRQRTTLIVPLTASTPGMKAGPPLESVGDSLRMQGGGPLDWSRIVAMQIFLARPDRPRTLEIFGVRWLPRPELRGIVDRFGQYARAEWPGKLHAEEEFALCRGEEQRWLANHPPAADRDEYGGWAAGPQLTASGFFRAEARDGRWWLVTPSGRLFWSVGTTCVRAEDSWPISGRREMFTWLPDEAGQKHVAFYRLNLPFISARQYEHKPGPAHRLPDFFDERFPAIYDAAIAKIAATCREDPWCVGYFVDNELAWGSWAQSGAGGDCQVAREAIAAPPSVAARRAMVKILQVKYPTVAEFAKAWQVRMSSWDDSVSITPSQLNAASRADCSAFMTALAERYFRTIRAAMQKQVHRSPWRTTLIRSLIGVAPSGIIGNNACGTVVLSS